MSDFYKRISDTQNELKAPKNQYNSFGKYNYRSCEDILEAVKPLCAKNKIVLQLSDKPIQIGERYYIEATATLIDMESGERLSSTASAREADTKKGMDESQVTGTASSYARKYALNGLFNIDDTKDADTDEHKRQTGKDEGKKQKVLCKSCGAEVPEDMAEKTKSKLGAVYCRDCGNAIAKAEIEKRKQNQGEEQK